MGHTTHLRHSDVMALGASGLVWAPCEGNKGGSKENQDTRKRSRVPEASPGGTD